MGERRGSDGVDPAAVSSAPRAPRSSGATAMGRAMMGLGELIEGKPPSDAYEHVMEVDESGEPEDPDNPVDPRHTVIVVL